MKYLVFPFLALIACLINSCGQSLNYAYSEVMTNQWNPTDYKKQRYAIGMASLKGFHGNVYYLGSDEGFHYFKVEKYSKFFRVKRTEMDMGKIFPVGKGEPYLADVPHR